MRQRPLLLLLATVFCFSQATHADTPGWTFQPRRLGSALLDGGWMAERSLGAVNGSPEFTFPLQLAWLSARTQRGPFNGSSGDQWFCPQLESHVLPKGAGALLWQTPGGEEIAFRVEKTKSYLFKDHSGLWQACVRGTDTEITHLDGWRYLYKSARLFSLVSPTGRVLEFSYKGSAVSQVTLRDPQSGATRILITADYDAQQRLESLDVCGLHHQFAYESGRDGRLAAWTHPGESKFDRFVYGKAGELASIQPAVGEPVVFTTKFTPPLDARGQPQLAAAEQKKVANYKLADDGVFKYTYGEENGGGTKYRARKIAPVTTITAENKAGAKQTLSQDLKKGVITSQATGGTQPGGTLSSASSTAPGMGGTLSSASNTAPGMGGTLSSASGFDGNEEKSIFYLAPGQKYDGKLWRVERNGVIVAEYRYDKKTGVLLEVRDQNGVTTFYEYPAGWMRPTRILRGTGDKKELVSQLQYDTGWHLVAQADAQGRITRFNYNARGELESVLDPDGNKIALTSDPFGRRVAVAVSGTGGAGSAGGNTALTQKADYDQNGRLRQQTAPDGQVTEYGYDAKGNLAEIKQNGVVVTKYQRDDLGLIAAQTDALGRTTKFEHDLRGNLLAERQPNGSTTKYEYDAMNRRVAQIDGNGNRIAFAYDPAGHLVKQTNPLGETQTWTYDAKGKLQQRANGEQTITYRYDAKDRLTAIDYGDSIPGSARAPHDLGSARAPRAGSGAPAGTSESTGTAADLLNQKSEIRNQKFQRIAYEHDENSRLKKASTPTTSVAYAYDAQGRVVAKQFTRAGIERLLRYTYDASGRKTSLTLSEETHSDAEGANSSNPKSQIQNLKSEYRYDTFGRLIEIRANDHPICVYQYDTKGRLARRTFGNGITGAYTYDAFGRQSRLELSGGPLEDPLLLAYQWDAAGQLLARHWNSETQTYTYDLAGQLLTVSAIDISAVQGAANNPKSQIQNPKLIESYRYDPAGNMLSKTEGDQTTTMTYNAANELVSSSCGGASTSFAYDKAGRLIARNDSSIPQSAIRIPQFQFGFLDKVLAKTAPDGTRTSFDYWPDGQLAATYDLSPSSNPKSEILNHKCLDEFLWDDLALIYLNGECDVIEPHANGGSCIARIKDGQISYDINDLLGTTLAIVSDTELKLTPLTAFGKPKTVSPNPGTPAPLEPPVVPTINPAPAQTIKTK